MIETKTVITIDPTAFRKHTSKLSHEAKGFYIDLLTSGADLSSLPTCEYELGHILGLDVRKVRRLKAELVKAKLLQGRFGLKGGA